MTDTEIADNKAAAEKVFNILQLFRSIDPQMPIGAARSFLLIAAEQGKSVTDLKSRGGHALASASRYHRYLGEIDRNQKPGMGLVVAKQNVEDSRKKSLKLTPKGRLLMGGLNAILQRKVKPSST